MILNRQLGGANYIFGGIIMARSIEDLMAASTRGEILKNVAIVESARKNDAPFVIGIYAVGAVISLILSASFYGSAGTRVFVNILTWAAWVGIGYLFIAIGTKLSHNMATWGVALVGGILASLNVLGSIMGLATLNTANNILAGSDIHVPGAGTFVSLMLISAAVAAGAFFLAVKMNRAMKTLAVTAVSAPVQYIAAPQQPYGPSAATPHPNVEQ